MQPTRQQMAEAEQRQQAATKHELVAETRSRTTTAMDILERQALEARTAAADEGKVWWRYRLAIPRREVPPWLLYRGGSPAKQSQRADRGLAWMGERLQIQLPWPPNTLLGLKDEAGSDVHFELLGWRDKGYDVRVMKLDGSVLLDTAPAPKPGPIAPLLPNIKASSPSIDLPIFEPMLDASAGSEYARKVVGDFMKWRATQFVENHPSVQ